MEREPGNELVRLSQEERHLIFNYRRVNNVRQDSLLYFSDELVKLEAEDRAARSCSVVVQIRPK